MQASTGPTRTASAMTSMPSIGTPSFARCLAEQYGFDDVPASSVGGRAALGLASVHYDLPHLFVLPPLPPEDAFVLSVELSVSGSRRFFEGRTQTQIGVTPPGTLHIADLARQPVSYVCSPFHSMLFHMSRSTMAEFADDAGLSPVGALACDSGATDMVMAGLARALLPSLLRPQEASALFLDHVALALYAHVAHTYGGARAPEAVSRGGLAPWQLRRAEDFMLSQLAHNVALADVARECGLSRSHFGKAFKQATGQTPHAWLTARRIEAVQRLLLESSAPLSAIALACGFADQSHLTRVFRAQVRSAPAGWRREHLN